MGSRWSGGAWKLAGVCCRGCKQSEAQAAQQHNNNAKPFTEATRTTHGMSSYLLDLMLNYHPRLSLFVSNLLFCYPRASHDMKELPTRVELTMKKCK
jgi:hypothetical protein